MKKIIYLFLVISLVCIFFIPKKVFCAKKSNLYEKFLNKSVNVFVDTVKNSTNENKVDTADLKQKITTALDQRKTIDFNVVSDECLADISISCDIIKYYWLKTDPIDMIYGTGALAYDIATNDNYAYNEVLFTVFDAKKKKKLWKEKLRVDITKSKMSEEQSMPLLNEKTASAFIKRCFSKRYNKDKNKTGGIL